MKFEPYGTKGAHLWEFTPENPDEQKSHIVDLDCRVKPGNDIRKESPGMTSKKNKTPGDDIRKEFLLREKADEK